MLICQCVFNLDNMDQWKSIQFTTEEDEIVTTDYANSSSENNIFNLCLVGSLCSNSSFNYGAFKNTIVKMWKLRQGVETKEIGKNLFTFQFFHWKDKENATGRTLVV